MSYRQQLAAAALAEDTVLTIGVFDGVHQGHRHLLRRLTQLARPDYRAGVVTFTNHPASVIRSNFQVSFITTPEQKIRLLKEQGIDLVVPLEFTPELSQVSAADFATTLVQLLHMKGLVVGPDFALGKDRQGNAEFLQKLGLEMGFWVKTVEPLVLDGVTVRSRRIRQTITQGDVVTGNKLLGWPFFLSGTVVEGAKRGRQLGFPTANLATAPDIMLPGDGIYATWAVIDGKNHPAATSIGIRPTFGLTDRLVEVYVIDFDGDLYGQTVGVEFVKKLRNQETFSEINDLVQQVNQDVTDARAVLDQDTGAHVG